MPKNAKSLGFTLAEFTVIFAIIGLLAAVFLPRFIRSKDRERESEIKANIHYIQVCLERYAVDTGGYYPYILYGGDQTDTFVKLGAPVNPSTGVSYYFPPDNPEYPPFPGDYDALVQYGYLAQFPSNPFMKGSGGSGAGKVKTNPAENGFGPLERARTNIWLMPFDRSLYYVRRLVGGENGNSMWDVSEGQRHAPWPVVVIPAPQPDWTGYVNPAYPGSDDQTTTYARSHQFYLTPGNFYYYAIFEGLAGYSPLISGGNPKAPPEYITGYPVGYRLCGYGGPTNVGEDVYNLWGDFEDRSLFTTNNPATRPLTIKSTYVGPDGRPDGVIISVSSELSVRE